MSQGTFRFWSLDPVYQKIVRTIEKKGVVVPGGDFLHKFSRLYQGIHFLFGKAEGRFYPHGSHHVKKPTTSFPAVLYITTESREQLRQIEKRFGLDKVPDYRRSMSHLEKEPYLPPLRSPAYRDDKTYLRSKYNPHRKDYIQCENMRREMHQEATQ